MKKTLITMGFCAGLVAAAEAAPTDAVTQADLQALKALIQQQNAKIEAQAKRIAELEGKAAQVAAAPAAAPVALKPGEGTTTNETGSIWSTPSGAKFYLADAAAGIFAPLTESGLLFEPYGYLVLEGVHNTDGTDWPMYTDWVRPRSNRNVKSHNGDHTTTLSVNDSILGFKFYTPESQNGWKTGGKFEFDLAGDDANHTDFHVRHLYWELKNEEKGWNFLFGQTWHLWKMVAPQEIDGAWMEQTGYPYRRSPQVRVTKKWDFDNDSSLEIRAGLVKNGPGMGGDRDGDGTQDNEQSAWCLLEGAVVYDHKVPWDDDPDKRWLLGIAGQYGRDRSRRAVMDADGNIHAGMGRNDEYDSDMVMIAGSIPFGSFKLTGQIFAGENLGGVQAGIGQKVGFRDPTRKGREVSTVGGFADLRYDLNDTWAFAIGYGFDDPTDSEAKYDGGRLYNDRAYVDAFYQFNANLHFGLEYAYLTTKYDEAFGSDADDHRIQFSVWYDF